MFKIKSVLFLAFITSLTFYGQTQVKEYSFGDGFRFTAKDSTLGVKVSARFQTLFLGNWSIHNDDFSDVGQFNSNFLIRRARLKFDGFAYSPKLTYKVELGLSNRDLNHGGPEYYGEGGNLVLDAYLKWNFFKAFSIKAGQFKLPGNRERIVSSANMQFVDRSALNSKFTLDRDIGASLHYDKVLGKQFGLHLTAALSQGEGRNVTMGNLGGYKSSFKLEIMPFGAFAKKGAYIGADIYREQKPKLALAFMFDINGKAVRSRGNRGEFLSTDAIYKDLYTGFIDFMFKYKGFSAMGEYAIRRTADNNRSLVDAEGNSVGAYDFGSAINLQAGYLFKSNYEIAARFTEVSSIPGFSGSPNQIYYTLAASKYIKNHSLKIQTDVSYIENRFFDDALQWRVQIEFGF
ncbi:porin [Brumimicrobium oceani]|uniref:Porin n=1 Tax=Brumimicrobium oceani TaxID=2100725 RepID=A0A2U2XB58_9FLAO|nr:porin [Brumimicrobium oceani]PWH84997.1 hypothetical protein DIT68_11530 [Brumimicrobium oceani]